ncbi:MAG: copper chaperone PCu(A)C [Nitrospirota bacterium]
MSIPSITGSHSLKVLQFAAVMLCMVTGCTSQPPQVFLEGQHASLSPVFIGAASVFFKIRNDGGKDSLVRATVDAPDTVIELHDMQDNRMVRVEKIAIPSRSIVDLRPGGQHIMIFNLPKTVQDGSELVLTLTFERSGVKQMPVRFTKEQ